ncbi:unnamed protein product [Durusdinium trenchii]|uniref:Uncharacterized protein n=1 Tax=Durusdinium trenchii TaxID=1381693 RepID=A0ABP0HWX6_9DINO
MVITLRPFRLGFFTFLGFFDRPSEAATYAIDAHGHSRALMRQEATNRQASLEEGDPDNDCVWGDWQDWTQCTVTCGNGMRTRQKSQESIGEEAVCEEPKMKSQSQVCSHTTCPTTTSTTFTMDPFEAETTTEPDTESASGGLASAMSDVASSLNPFSD